MMWNRPWHLAEGFVISCGLIATGLILQLIVGKVNWPIFQWPINIIAMACLIVIIGGLSLARKKSHTIQFISSSAAAVPAIACAALMTVVMGLTRQQDNGTWLGDMLAFWPFVLVYTYIVVILGLVIVRRICQFGKWRRDLPFVLNHLGLFIAISTATLGNADIQKARMVAYLDFPTNVVINDNGQETLLPIAIQLEKFTMEVYNDGSPKRFASDVTIYNQKTNRKHKTTIDVNHPAEVDGWKIYQYGYDQQRGALSQYSIFELVRDPWQPAVYAGIYMMIAGALLLLLNNKGKASL